VYDVVIKKFAFAVSSCDELLVLVSGYMLCLVCYLFIIGTSAIDCMGRFVSEVICHVSSGMLNLTS